MPLPDNLNGTIPWPPPGVDRAMPKLTEWATWYGGDPDALAKQYANGGAPAARPSQYRGGAVGAVARWFWGAPQQPTGPARAKLHLPIASDIATASADLLFSEEVKVTLPEEYRRSTAAASPVQDRVETVLDGLSWSSFLPEQAESAAALGGVFHRVVWDKDVADHPLVGLVHMDCAWPEFVHGRLKAVTFWDTAYREGNGGRVVRILERHERGRIEWGAYEGTEDKLGRRVDFGILTSLGLAAPKVDAQSGIATQYDGLTATFIPNLRPVRAGWRLDAYLSNYGRSDLWGIEPLLDAADETMTAWMRDLRLAKSRILVPEQFLTTSTAAGVGSYFNLEQEAFVAVNTPATSEDPLTAQITAQQFAIRHAEHAATLAGILGAAFRGAGYSQQTFGIAGEAEGTATATEVNARESRSNRTREKKSRYMTDGLPRTLAAVFAIDRAHFRGAVPEGMPLGVEFPDITRDPEVEARTVQIFRAAQVMSILTGVKRAQPDLDDTEALAEVQRIYEDEKNLTPALPDLGALPGDEEPDPDAPPPGNPADVG